jgi:hypothetical protein
MAVLAVALVEEMQYILEEQETLHQYHHHKEIMAVVLKRWVIKAAAVAVRAGAELCKVVMD